jgi:hypothetical protein
MNKSVTLLLTLAIALILNGCDNKKSNSSDTTNTPSTTCTGGGEVKHGYQLPPCPDPTENDKTLLGIDSNNNGVRDDVEIWIYNTYDTYQNCTSVKTGEVVHEGVVLGVTSKRVCTDEYLPYHQIVREIAMQYARAYQIIIQEPEKARENKKFVDGALYCQFYFEYDAKRHGDPILIDTYSLYGKMDNIQFNTIQRARAYSKYNSYLSGGAYSDPGGLLNKRLCDFDVDALLEKQL